MSTHHTLHHAASHCNTLNTLQHTATHCTRMMFLRCLSQETVCRHITHCNTLQHTASHCNTLQYTATHCNTLQHTATHCTQMTFPRCLSCETVCRHITHCNTLQSTATHCNTLQHIATHCNTLQHTATRCNTLQHTLHSNATPSMFVAGDCVSTHHTLQHTATHCNTLQHTATRCNTRCTRMPLPRCLSRETVCRHTFPRVKQTLSIVCRGIVCRVDRECHCRGSVKGVSLSRKRMSRKFLSLNHAILIYSYDMSHPYL